MDKSATTANSLRENDLVHRVENLSPAKRKLFEQRMGMGRSVGPRHPSMTRRSDREHIPLSFAQQRMWVLDQMDPGIYINNVSRALSLSGPLDVDALERSLDEILRRHEALRTTFPLIDGNPVQVITPVSY